MYSPEVIADMSAESAVKARRSHAMPRVFFDQADRDARPGNIPDFGDYRPKGWEMVEHRLVDSSGMGSENEPALTLRQYKAWLNANPESGFAIVETGQFQVVVGRFEKS